MKNKLKEFIKSIKEKKLQKPADNFDLDKQLEEFKEKVKARLAEKKD